MIKRLELQNFSAFEKLDIDFSQKINVVIGENGTGKSQLLKSVYCACPFGILKPGNTSDMEFKNYEITLKLLRVFMPIEDKLGKLHTIGTEGNSQLKAVFSNDEKIEYSFHTNSKQISIQSVCENECCGVPIFIPTKEVLSFMKGFQSLYEKSEISFDKTYHALCVELERPELRREALHVKADWAIKEIEKTCNGKFIFYGSGKVTFKTATEELSANSSAEGFRKIGILARLLETGAIQPGVSGPLLWDEPEANMNPYLLRMLVEILLELSRQGIQIILATHNYTLIKWLELLRDTEKKDDHICYHVLYRENMNSPIKLKSTEDYYAITPNKIDDAFVELANQEIINEMGGLGK